MAFNLVDQQDAIKAHLQLAMPNTPIFEDSTPDEVSIQRDADGQMVPYIILRYSPVRQSAYGRSLGGARYDEYYATIDVMTCAPVGRMARQMMDVCTDTLTGFDPGSGGQMVAEMGAGIFVVTSNEVRPIQYVNTLRMRYNVNGRNVGEPLP